MVVLWEMKAVSEGPGRAGDGERCCDFAQMVTSADQSNATVELILLAGHQHL